MTSASRSPAVRQALAKATWIRLADLTRAQIRGALDKLDEHPTTANRALALVKVMLSKAVDVEIIPLNPLAGMKQREGEGSRSRVLKDDEVRALWQMWGEAPERDRPRARCPRRPPP